MHSEKGNMVIAGGGGGAQCAPPPPSFGGLIIERPEFNRLNLS